MSESAELTTCRPPATNATGSCVNLAGRRSLVDPLTDPKQPPTDDAGAGRAAPRAGFGGNLGIKLSLTGRRDDEERTIGLVMCVDVQ